MSNRIGIRVYFQVTDDCLNSSDFFDVAYTRENDGSLTIRSAGKIWPIITFAMFARSVWKYIERLEEKTSEVALKSIMLPDGETVTEKMARVDTRIANEINTRYYRKNRDD